MSNRSNRRDFLRSAALGIGTLGLSEMMASRLFHQLTMKAFASTWAPNPSGYYFHISFPSAPPRWLFDLPLTPGGKTASNVMTPGFGTAFEKVGSATNVVYSTVAKTVAGKTLHLPPVWNYHTSKNFDSVLQHALFVRGMDMEIDSHGVSNLRQISPVVGGLTLNGAVADRSDRAIASVVDGAAASSTSYKAQRGFTPINVNTGTAGNILTYHLIPFAKLPTNRLHIAGQNLMLQEQVFSQIEEDMLKAGFSKNTIGDSYNKAADLIDANIQALANEYIPAKTRYTTLVKEALLPTKGTLPGLFSQAIPISKTNPQFNFNRDALASDFGITDLRDCITPDTNVARMAETFAMMEVLSDRLSSNFAVGILSPQALKMSSTRSLAVSNDQHTCGKFSSTLISTLYYRAFLSCLTEFVGALKSKNIFNHSVIHISSEFNRIPRNDGTGSDHGPQGSGATLISGKFASPQVIGNIKINGTGRGTWGEAAPYSLFNRSIKVNDVARSISAMLGIADVVTNGESLVKPSSGGLWIPKKVEAKNV